MSKELDASTSSKGNMTFSDFAKNALMKVFVFLIYIVSHLYDYLFYPIYFLFQHPWVIRRYNRSNHARREDREDCVIFHSIVEPFNIEIQRKQLDTMNKVFGYFSTKFAKNDCLGTREVLAEEDEKQPNGKVFQKLKLGEYKWTKYAQLATDAERVGNGLRSIGLKAGDKIAILAETRADWMIMAYACFKNNITIVTIYATLGSDGVKHALTETKAPVLVCSQETISKVKEIEDMCPDLRKVIVMSTLTLTSSETTLRKERIEFDDLKKYPETGDGQTSAQEPTAKDCAIIMYTSGSTGNPKGVMLSHHNLVSALSSLSNVAPFKPKDRYIGYLPLAHVLELLSEVSCLMCGVKIGYSSAGTLTNKSSKVKSGSKGDANKLRPTLMCTVPLILERIYKTILDTMKRHGWAAEELFQYFVEYKLKWQDRGFDTPILNKTVFRKIRYFLGGRVRLMLSGGAPLSPDTHNLARTVICVPLMQGYGLTETTACATVMSPKDRSSGRVGAPLMNVQIKLVNWEEGNYTIKDNPNPRGEIHIGGDNVAMGYYEQDEKTREEFYEEDGRRWFRTGDIGEVEADGVIRIIDRKKDLVKLQHGEYISFGKVESILKTCPIVENICMVGSSSKNYVVGVLLPDKIQLAKITDVSVEDAAQSEDIIKKIVKNLTDFGLANGLSRMELPTKIVLSPVEWTPDSGLVTAAFKIRRRFIETHFNTEIEKIYT